jgi:hypothetical protein
MPSWACDVNADRLGTVNVPLGKGCRPADISEADRRPSYRAHCFSVVISSQTLDLLQKNKCSNVTKKIINVTKNLTKLEAKAP